MELLLLHGALGSSEQLVPLQKELANDFDVHLLNFSGHGGKEIPSEFSISLFANDVIGWMDRQGISSINLFGYSMGGYVALYLARYFPHRVNKIFTLATKFNWSPESSLQEVKMLDPVKIQEKIPEFARTLAIRHAPADWKLVMNKTAK